MTGDEKASFAGVEMPGAKMEGDFLRAEAEGVPVSSGGAGTVTVTVDPRAEAELRVRGRRDILDELDAEAKIRRICDALDELGVPRQAPPGEPVSEGQPLDVESRVRWLGSERDRLRRPTRDQHRRVRRAVVVEQDELTKEERTYAHPTGTPEMWEVLRWEDSEATKIVKRAFGDDVDLSDGTFGDALVRTVTAEMSRLDALRDKLLALAATLRGPEGEEPPWLR